MKNNIKVLHIDSERGWRGGQQQAVYLFERMHEQGYDTKFICKPGTALGEYFTKNKLPFLEVKMRNELDLFSAHRIASFCRTNGYQILHLHAAHAMAIGLLAKVFYPKLKLIGVRRVDFHIKDNFFSRLKYSTKLLDKLVCISHGIKKVVLSDGVPEEKIEVIHSGIDTHKFDNVMPPADFRKSISAGENDILIGTVAAMVGHKDYPNLLKAAKIVLSNNDNVTFCAVGKGRDEAEVKSLHAELGLGDRFIFTGFRKDVANFLKTFDLFVMASKLEGLGTSILDAQANGLPVVACETGGIPEAVKHEINGLLVPPQDHERLASALQIMIDDQVKREQYGQTSLETVKDFDINITVQKNIELYGKLLNNG